MPVRSFSDEHGTGTFHSLGDLPKRKQVHIPHDVPFPSADSPPPSPPIRRSNGKPLKSSLKSSSSSPVLSTPPLDHRIHLRARSEPSTPAGPPKNVHFPETDYALATVRVYHRSARPAALSSQNGAGDETETEGEDTPQTHFPFPPSSSPFNYEIDPTRSTLVPCQLSPLANLILESLHLSCPSSSLAAKTLLTGSILVRNLAFEKHIAIRFTLDDWQTVSEVGTRYLTSLPHLPSQIQSAPSLPEDVSPHKARGWDRFTFTIRLEDHAHALTTRTLWLAARYRVNSTYPDPGSTRYGPGGEWWDNNGGRNYCIGFRPAVTPTPPRSTPRRNTVSASTLLPHTSPQPATASKEHAFGHMVPSAPSHQENQTDKRPVSVRAGKLSLCNYVPPTTSPSSITNSELSSSATVRLSSDEQTPSPAPSTPSLSMVPRVIISGQPATIALPQPSNQGEVVTGPKPSPIADWDWPAPSEGPLYQRIHLGLAELPKRSGGNPLADGRSLYDTFVRQWCFAQGPSPSHHGYDGGGIMA